MKSAKSCGGLVFRKEQDRILYLVIKHKEEDGGHWDFPKGHVDPGETEEQTALREIYEETGLKVEFVPGYKETINYIDHLNNVDKTVVFFLCQAFSGKVEHITDDVIDHVWMEYDQAKGKLTHDSARVLLRKADELLNQHQ